MPKVLDIPMTPPKILLYGEVGCGKTALLLTLGAKLQVADMDGGLRTGLTLKDKFLEDRRSVDVRQFLETEPHKRANAFKQMKDFIYGLPAEIQSKRYPFKAFGLDSLSSFSEGAVRYIMSNSGRVNDPPEIQHWGLAFNEIKNVLGVIRSLPIPFILIAHEQVKTIGKGATKEDKLEIAVSGKNLPSQICRYFDEIWYMRARPVGAGKHQYVVQTVGDEVIAARSRGNLPNYTDTACGLWELLKQIGYDPKEPING